MRAKELQLWHGASGSDGGIHPRGAFYPNPLPYPSGCQPQIQYFFKINWLLRIIILIGGEIPHRQIVVICKRLELRVITLVGNVDCDRRIFSPNKIHNKNPFKKTKIVIC